MLDLSSNNIATDSEEGMVALGEALQKLNNLKTLNLAMNNIGTHGAEGSDALGKAMANLQQLTYLNISHNMLGNAALSLDFFANLHNLVNITNLDLSYNKLGSQSKAGLDVLGESFSGMQQLVSLKSCL